MLYADSFLYVMLMLCIGGLWLERVPVALMHSIHDWEM